MYHTPEGDRILLDAERRFFVGSLASIVDLLADSDMEFGVATFDRLQRMQKLVVLYRAARGLLHPSEPLPRFTADLEAAVATVFEFAKWQVNHEEDDPSLRRETLHCRRMALDAARQQGVQDDLPCETDDDEDRWNFVLECLAGRVLWDNDYEIQQTLDLPPQKSRQVRTVLGIDDDYHTAIPDEPPDDQANLYVDALIGLTVEAR